MNFDDWQAIGYALGLALLGILGVIAGLLWARWLR